MEKLSNVSLRKQCRIAIPTPDSHLFKSAKQDLTLTPRSRVCSFLDNDPSGQWLRYSHLGINQELLSPELLLSVSRKNLDIYHPHSSGDIILNYLISHPPDTTLSDMVRDCRNYYSYYEYNVEKTNPNCQ